MAKAEQPDLFILVRTLFHAWTEARPEVDLDTPPAVWEQVEKYDLDAPFWQMVKTTFGYAEDNHRITTARHRFQLIQMEPVSERVKPVTLKVAVYEGEELATNVESVTFASGGRKGHSLIFLRIKLCPLWP